MKIALPGNEELVAPLGWGAGTTTLRKAALALVHSTAQYCFHVCYL